MSCAYAPHQNGIAEWMKSLFFDVAMSILKERYVLKDVWANAAVTAVYLIVE